MMKTLWTTAVTLALTPFSVHGVASSAEFVSIFSRVNWVTDVSADGRVILGYGEDATWEGTRSWKWTRGMGLSLLEPNDFRALELSANGSVVIGSTTVGGASDEATWYSAGNGTTKLDAKQTFEMSHALDVSDNGSVIVGIGNRDGDDVAYRWTQESGMQDLGLLPNSSRSSAVATSADGSIVVGQSSSNGGRLNRVDILSGEAFRWSLETGMVGLGMLEGDQYSGAWKVSGDGNTVVGESGTERNLQAFRWTPDGGMDGLGYLPGLGPSADPTTRSGSRAWDVTPDGNVILGQSFSPTDSRAFVWDPVHGMRNLQNVLLAEHGLSVPGKLDYWLLISDDQMTLAGMGRSSAASSRIAWAVFLDKPLVSPLGDFNDDHYRDAADIDLLSRAISESSTDDRWDVNYDGEVTDGDRVYWVHDLANTYFGDTNLDGEFNSGDLVTVFRAGQYEDNLVGNSGWATGDWNGDAEFTTSDLVLAFQDGGYEQGPRRAVSAVPEPTSAWPCLTGVLFLARCRRRRYFL